jgi:hypothetical protein
MEPLGDDFIRWGALIDCLLQGIYSGVKAAERAGGWGEGREKGID